MQIRIKDFPEWVQTRIQTLALMYEQSRGPFGYEYGKGDKEIMEEAIELFNKWDEITPR